jgi:predicted  nucleic acid-binding Zn-ribbon protein
MTHGWGEWGSLKREKEQLQAYLAQQESEVKAAMAGKGGEVSGLASQVDTLKEQLSKAEGAVTRLKQVRSGVGCARVIKAPAVLVVGTLHHPSLRFLWAPSVSLSQAAEKKHAELHAQATAALEAAAAQMESERATASAKVAVLEAQVEALKLQLGSKQSLIEQQVSCHLGSSVPAARVMGSAMAT